MAKSVAPLTNTQANKAKPKDKEYSLADGGGLYLRIRPSGSKIWVFNYQRPDTKKRTNLGFGSYPEVGIADARQKRIEARGLLAKGIDPKLHAEEEARKEEAASLHSLEYAAHEWLQVKRTKVSDDYAIDVERSLKLHIFPEIGNIHITKINAPAVIGVLKPIAAKGSLETVKRLCQRLNEIMTYAVNTGMTFHNPLSGIRDAFQSPPKVNMPSISPEQLPEFMHKLSRASIKNTTRFLIEWQLHTMVRPSEAAGARWDEIDWDGVCQQSCHCLVNI